MSQVNPGSVEFGYAARMIEAHHSSTAGAGIPSRKLICVIDDDFDVLKSLRFLLETEGFDVRTFRSASALLGSRARHEADCLVVDYRMAGVDGLELTQRLRDLGITKPVVLITGYPDESIAAKANSAGVREVLIKPNLGDSLVASVRNAVNSDRTCD